MLFHVWTLSYIYLAKGCNYIKWDGYPVPVSICQQDETLYCTPGPQYESYYFQCSGSNTMIKYNYFCSASNTECSNTNAPCSSTYFVDTTTHTSNIQCSSDSNNCDYVQFYYYFGVNSCNQLWEQETTAIVINQCIDKQMYGCDDTSYWRVDYDDIQCTQPKSIRYWNPLDYYSQKRRVIECTSASVPPVITPSPTSPPSTTMPPSPTFSPSPTLPPQESSGLTSNFMDTFTQWFHENKIIAIGISCFLALVLLVIIIWIVAKCRKSKRNERKGTELSLLKSQTAKKNAYVTVD